MERVRGRLRTAVLVAGGVALAYQVTVPWLPYAVGLALSDLMIAVTVGVAAGNYLRMVRTTTGRVRAATVVGFVSSAAWAISNAFDFIGDSGLFPPMRNLGNLIALGAVVGLPLGIHLIAPPARGREGLRRLLDVAAVTGAVFSLTWLYVIQPAMGVTGDGMTAPFAAWLAAPEVLAAAVALVTMSRTLPSRDSLAPRMLGSAALVLAATTLLSLRNYVEEQQWYAGGVGGGYVFAAGLLLIASWQPAPRATPAGTERLISGRWAVLPYAPIILSVLAAAAEQVHAAMLGPVLVWVLLLTFALVLLRQFITMRIVARQAIELEEQQEALAHQATHDALTGLPNRAAFHSDGEKLLAAATEQVLVLLLDLDGFKPVNDSLGHAAGDEVLIAVAARLGRRVRPPDLVARLGGDEFAILLTRVPVEADGLVLADALLRDLAEPMTALGVAVTIGGSIGAAPGRPGADLNELLRRADLAMYAAKAAGKGTVRRFDPSTAKP